MKDFNGTLVIVDPGMFVKDEDRGRKINMEKLHISPKLGFRTMFLTETGIDNCFLTYHKVDRDEYREFFKNGLESFVKNVVSDAWSGHIKPILGTISVDSGVVGVFLLEDIEKYNPGCLEKYKADQDYVRLENFRGKIGYIRDKYGMVHFYGAGSTNFYTL